jgi:high-affinity iron transporter
MNEVSAALQSGLILLREGLEALLVIAALAAFLKRAGVPEKVKPLYLGAGLAILASFGAAVVFELFFGGEHNDFMEAGVMVIAAALMLYMSGWLFLRQDPKAWMSELRSHAERALDSGTAISLALIAFLAVFREGGETIVMLHAAATQSGGWSLGIVFGLVAATICLGVIYYVMQKSAGLLPLRPVFLVTSAFLFIMALRFIGGAIQELQEQTMVSFTDLPIPEWLRHGLDNLGFNTSWEAVGVQLAVAAVAVASTLALRLRRPGPAKNAQVAAE